MKRPSETDFNNGKIYDSTDQLYTRSSGVDMGLTLEMKPHLDEVAYVLQSNVAFRVFILETHNYPTEDMQPIIIGPTFEAFLGVFPKRITGDRSMVDISAESRGCFFHDEPNLIYEK